jgi:phage terminase Nu1 subunit (DNA packaging protein)
MQPQDWTLHALSIEVKRPYAVVARRLSNVPPHRVEGKTRYYRLADALPHLYEGREHANDSREEAERRRSVAEAQLAELKVLERQGEVVPIGETAATLQRAFTAVRARLLSIPTKLSPILIPDDPNRARTLLEAAMLEALAELEQHDDIPDEPGSEEEA